MFMKTKHHSPYEAKIDFSLLHHAYTRHQYDAHGGYVRMLMAPYPRQRVNHPNWRVLPNASFVALFLRCLFFASLSFPGRPPRTPGTRNVHERMHTCSYMPSLYACEPRVCMCAQAPRLINLDCSRIGPNWTVVGPFCVLIRNNQTTQLSPQHGFARAIHCDNAI